MRRGVLLVLALMLTGTAAAADTSCDNCKVWNTPQKPFRIFGNTYYVGPHGLSAILITSESGHVLIDGALPESAAQIAAHIRELGFRLEDVKLILNSHVHFDHAGGIAELQRLTGAAVKVSASTATVMKTGGVGEDDPQFGTVANIAPVGNVSTVADGEMLHLGPLALTAHFTPGHTAGGTTWTWDSCESARCLHMVYADSLFAAGADGYRFSDHPDVVQSFERSFTRFTALPCNILVSAHPEFSELWGRLQRRDQGDADGLVDHNACTRYVGVMQRRLADTLAVESTPRR